MTTKSRKKKDLRKPGRNGRRFKVLPKDIQIYLVHIYDIDANVLKGIPARDAAAHGMQRHVEGRRDMPRGEAVQVGVHTHHISAVHLQRHRMSW